MKRIFTPIRIYYIIRLYVKFICGHNRSPSRLVKHEYKSVDAYKGLYKPLTNNELIPFRKDHFFFMTDVPILEKSIPPSVRSHFFTLIAFNSLILSRGHYANRHVCTDYRQLEVSLNT